jgi:hypothetical protein
MADDKIVRCDCGYTLRARSEQRQVAEVRRHAWEGHGIAFSTEEALAVLLRWELAFSEREPTGAAMRRASNQTEGGGAR